MSSQEFEGSTLAPGVSGGQPVATRRIRLLVAALIASTFVPTMIAVIAGTASLDQPQSARMPLLVGPPTYPIIIDGAAREESSGVGVAAPSASAVKGGRQVTKTTDGGKGTSADRGTLIIDGGSGGVCDPAVGCLPGSSFASGEPLVSPTESPSPSASSSASASPSSDAQSPSPSASPSSSPPWWLFIFQRRTAGQ